MFSLAIFGLFVILLCLSIGGAVFCLLRFGWCVVHRRDPLVGRWADPTIMLLAVGVLWAAGAILKG